ncbi:MAG TPA: glycosyltransferase [Anaerolineales bacterium]
MNCSIVIHAYNEEEHIGRLLEGICQQRGNPWDSSHSLLVDLSLLPASEFFNG